MIDHRAIQRNGEADYVKVVIELNPSEWHASSAESLWAHRLGPSVAVLRNVPFHAYGYSLEDSVAVEEREGRLYVQQTLEPGGHSTYRLFLSDGVDPSSAKFLELWNQLEIQGCTFESSGRLLAVDVPAASDIHQVYAVLEQGQEAGLWDFEEAHCSHEV